MNKKAEEEMIFDQKMQENVARNEFMELAKNLHRNFKFNLYLNSIFTLDKFI